MSQPNIIIVNENDEIIGYKERGTLCASDIYRVSALWIQNSQGEILLAQRSFNKKNDPGKWGPAVAGTVEQNETYESNIIKEIEEEIGLTNCNLTKSIYRFNNRKNKYFYQLFFALIDKDIDEFTIQKEEVEKIKWFKKEELLQKIKDNPNSFLKSIEECVNLFQ